MKIIALGFTRHKFTAFIVCIMAAAYPVSLQAQFVKGADIGWLQQMEATGYKFYNSDGVNEDCILILKEKQINTVRLRVWVNPSSSKTDGHCSKKEVAQMAVRAKNAGMRVMIDFHYSDSWADPGKQNKPAAWANHSFSQLLDDVYNHTFQVLDTLKSLGATPDWVQVGNEIAGGMLWPDGKSSNWPQLAQLLNKGYDAAKAVDPSIRVIIHLESGNNNNLFRWFFDNATSYHVNYDIIGASYYPYWDNNTDYTTSIGDLGNNLADIASRYGKDVMVVETGGPYYKVQNTYDMLVAVMKKVAGVAGGKGLGVIYWEPEGEKTWSGYDLSCWNSDGKPTNAINAFLTDPYLAVKETEPDAAWTISPESNTSGKWVIDLRHTSGNTSAQLIDLSGKIVRSFTLTNQLVTRVDLRQWHGVYLFRIVNGWNASTRKIVLN